MYSRFSFFLFLALLIHLALLSVVKISAFASPLYYQYIQLLTITEDSTREDVNSPEETTERNYISRLVRKIPPKPAPQSLVLIPIPVDKRVRWIVELLDIPNPEEPQDANFVSETPSRVNEEIQAERTSRNPQRKAPKKNSTGESEYNEEQEIPPQRMRRVSQNSGRRRTPIHENEPARESPSSPSETSNSEDNHQQPSGIPAEEAGNMPVTSGENEVARKETPTAGNVKLLPSYAEIARSEPTNEPSIPGEQEGSQPSPNSQPRKEPGARDGVPGVAEAPENFLPFVKKKGDITLLNAKSYKYASFVRRVARRMFDRFVIGFRPEPYYDANWQRIQRGAHLEAIMNKEGRLVQLIVVRATGNHTFDTLVRNAVTKEAWDSNVPDGAECADGFVHFIFIPSVIPSDPVDTPNGRIYSNYLLLAVAGLKECD